MTPHKHPRLAAIGLVVAALTWSGTASAQEDKTFGLGVMVGFPTGLAGKFHLSESPLALQFGAGAYYQVHDNYGRHIHADMLWHPLALSETDSFRIPVYVGAGLRLLDYTEYQAHDAMYDESVRVGLRIPIGLAFVFNNVPLDIFAELVPVWDFVHEDEMFHDHHHDDTDLTGAVGLRYYF